MARGGACIFCGKFVRKLSREHIWSDWMRHYLPAGLPGHSERWSTAEGRERWEQPLLKAQVRAPCKQCNNGWMGDVEKAAAPIVGPMIRGTRLLLDASAQHKVATWAVLKAMVTTRTSPKQESVPIEHFRAYFRTRTISPDTTKVWLGYRADLTDPNDPTETKICDSHFMPLHAVNRGFPVPSVELNEYLANGGSLYGMSIQVGRFFAVSLHTDWPGMLARPIPGVPSECLSQIWPTTLVAQWPPVRAVDVLGDPHSITAQFIMAPPGTEDLAV